MAAIPKDVHLLAHTARMLLVLERQKKHTAGPEYRKQIKTYAQRWSALTKDERRDVVKAAGEIRDLTEAAIAAAVAALEG